MDDNEKASAVARYRTLSGIWRAVFVLGGALALFLAINQIFSLKLLGISLIENRYLYSLLALYLAPVFLIFPATSRAPRHHVPWYDAVLFVVALAVISYFFWHGPDIILKAWEFTAPTEPTIIAIALWAIVLEAARRTSGLLICIVFGLLSLYPLVADQMPTVIAGHSFEFLATARYHAMSVESILGIAMRTFGSLIIGFLVFGVALQATGAGTFFLNLAFGLLGSVRGGPAKVAVVSSGLFGSLSGSAVSNVITTGSVTIPTMKRAGYPSAYAGGVEACASTGGVLMPPVMGATAFVMASFLGLPYAEIALAAAIPAFLYYYGLYMQIDAFAARTGLKGLDKSELPSMRQTLKDGWLYVFSFLALIYFLLIMRVEARAPFYATALLILCAMLRKETRMDVKRAIAFIDANTRTLAELVGIMAGVGLLIGSLSMTGMAQAFSRELVALAGGNVLLLLVLGALASFILGMGMTITACYVFLAIVMAPALTTMGLNPMAVHMFVLYWGMLSFITPPVALAVFAAAAIAGASVWRTGFEAMRLGTIIYFLPFFFVLNPALVLQESTASEIVYSITTAALGVTILSGGLQGHLAGVGTFGRGRLNGVLRGMLVLGGLLLATPEFYTDLVGLGLGIVAIVVYRLLVRPRAAIVPVSPETVPKADTSQL